MSLCPRPAVTAWSLTVLSLTLFSTLAFADIAPPNLAGCNGLKAGDTCKMDDGRLGRCAGSKISRPDYSQGTPPKRVQVELLVCQETALAKAPISPLVWVLIGGLFAAAAASLAGRWVSRPRPA